MNLSFTFGVSITQPEWSKFAPVVTVGDVPQTVFQVHEEERCGRHQEFIDVKIRLAISENLSGNRSYPDVPSH
ncbi:hypothetical protein CEXT_670011 [Caerostris extrusa]|uniref:Uncharacterized protein n=1 Tax=Caerostris extrusa TaxID=172846 RepID=A0AAV4PGX6_CAEEX|nr:hypothetical protein CEXT_670011 [Caerostris extrusa]